MSDSLTRLFAGSAGNGKPPNDDLDSLFNSPAGEPMPAGEYTAEVVSGRLGQSKSGKGRYELRLKVADGEHFGRAIFDDWYLTKDAMWKTGPFLAKLGIKSAEQCRRDFPPGWLARIRLKIESVDGVPRNKLADIAIVGRKPDDPSAAATVDPFAPKPSTVATPVAEQSEKGGPTSDARGDSWEHPADRKLPADQLSFSFGANADGPYGPGGDKP